MRCAIFGLVAAISLILPAAAPAHDVQAGPVPGEEHCVVNVAADDALNIRRRPGNGSAVLARLPYGRCGVVVTGDCRGNWCPVEDGHHAGWVHRRYLAMVSPAMYCVSGVESWDRLNLRAFPSASSRVVARLGPHRCGIAFLPYGVNGWQKVRVEGLEGWVNRRFVSGE